MIYIELQSFISCTQSVSWIGYTMMFEGVCRTLFSFLCGPLTKFIPRWLQLLVALVTQMVLCITWLLWKPSNNRLPLFLWAVGIAFVTGITWTLASGELYSLLQMNSALLRFCLPNYCARFVLCILVLLRCHVLQ